MKGFLVFIGLIIINGVLFLFVNFDGLLLIDLAFIMALLVLMYDNQKIILRKLNRKKDTPEQKNLLAQREAAERNFDQNDLPSIDEVKELNER
ncbi:hypothetical protein [Paenibacillus gallinarum]|uniref:Uncharacterized protein n=1 Tax=Paenibacillus gallinarum TaxID=2762232 RepID=A0ABR8ST13_9BACL|nr:hypothetical protein [Paenibacillus gallinarum]MBD7966639.1 hypothetical protein [Paenibacillus gallinarum]